MGAMSRIYRNMVKVIEHLRVQHFLFFAFGMGAFLRFLLLNDSKYNDDSKLQRIRRELARRFIDAFGAAPPQVTLHLCLQFSSDEALRNADAFIRALKGAPEAVKSRSIIWPEGDCLDLAHDLACTSPNVLLANGANRQLIGNHWFAGMAKRAIDENLHRRSWTLSATAYMLNNFGGRGELYWQAED